MLYRTFILHAKGMPFDGFQINAGDMGSAEDDMKYIFDLDGVEYWVEDTRRVLKSRKS